MNRFALTASLLLVALMLGACSGHTIQRKDSSSSARSFSVMDLAKSDVDNVIEIHQREVIATLRTLTLKLYLRNSNEWRKSGHASADDATAALFKPLGHWHLLQSRTLRGAPDMTADRLVARRRRELARDAKVLLDAIASLAGPEADDPFTDPLTLTRAVTLGLLDAPHLRNNKFACGRIRTSIVNGACVVVDAKGKVIKEEKRLIKVDVVQTHAKVFVSI